jgi:hypothetical protein
MGATGGAGEFTVVDYTNDLNTLFTKMDQLSTSVNNLTTAINQSIGATSLPDSIGKTAIASMNQVKAISKAQTDTNKKIGESFAIMQGIVNQLSGISSTLNTGVATQFILTADQMKKNAFDKAATQAALKRNNLPEVTVSNADFITTLESVLQDAGNVAAQASATGFVTTQANRAITAASNFVTGLLPSPGTIMNTFKSLLPVKAADKEGELMRTNNIALNTTTPLVPSNPVT